jgi:hypothetical protein
MMMMMVAIASELPQQPASMMLPAATSTAQAESVLPAPTEGWLPHQALAGQAVQQAGVAAAAAAATAAVRPQRVLREELHMLCQSWRLAEDVVLRAMRRFLVQIAPHMLVLVLLLVLRMVTAQQECALVELHKLQGFPAAACQYQRLG